MEHEAACKKESKGKSQQAKKQKDVMKPIYSFRHPLSPKRKETETQTIYLTQNEEIK